MKYFFLGMLSFLLLNTTQAQEMYGKMIPNIKAVSAQYADAYKEGNAEKLMALAPAIYTKAIGEKELQKEFKELTSRAKYLKMIKIGEPTNIQQVGTDMHALVSLFYITVNAEGKKMEVNTQLLAVSQDGGANWFLLNAEKAQKSSVAALNTTIEIPKTVIKQLP